MSSDTLNLEINAIIVAALSGLWGIYLMLFSLALWSTYRNRRANEQSSSVKRLRTVTIVLFFALLTHFIVRCLQFARARIPDPGAREIYKWGIPLTVVGNVTTTFAGLLSDGLLAWRFYVIYDRKKWALYIPATFVVINALLCWSADAQHLAIYFHEQFYEDVLLPVTLWITVAWGWLMFAVNTTLTAAIIGRIVTISRRAHGIRATGSGVSRYSTVFRALIESASVTWVGLLVYEISSLAVTGHVTTEEDVGYVMAAILPIFFGISQTLIIARLGFSNELGSTHKEYTTTIHLTYNKSNGSNSYGNGGDRRIHVETETVIDSGHRSNASMLDKMESMGENESAIALDRIVHDAADPRHPYAYSV